MMRQRSTFELAAFTALAAGLALLTGCGLNPGSAPTAVEGASFQGVMRGGQQPIVGASMQLYAAGTGGYGSAASALLSPAVTTVANGSFSITGKYTCPSASSQVYLVGTVGNPGGGTNTNSALMAALGSCGNLSSSTFVIVNEVTTVASVWALSPFMTGAANLGASATNAAGLQNAFADVPTLTDIANGVAPGVSLPAGTTVPATEINTLANVLAACVNSAGGVAGDGSTCGILFAAANPGTAPTDTLTAALNIAQHPALNVGTLFGLSSPTAPFQPALTTAPNDFTIAVNYASGFSSPSGLAVDASGNVWVANAGNNTVSKLTHTGAAASGSPFTGAMNAPSSIAFDASGNAWITNKGNNTLTELTGSGTVATGSPFSGGGLNQPRGIAFDSTGKGWVANGGSASVTLVNGTILTNLTGTGITLPIGIAVSPH